MVLEGVPLLDANGDRCWRNVAGQLHRDNDMPAIENVDDHSGWWINGRLHRDGGLPAVEKCGWP